MPHTDKAIFKKMHMNNNVHTDAQVWGHGKINSWNGIVCYKVQFVFEYTNLLKNHVVRSFIISSYISNTVLQYNYRPEAILYSCVFYAIGAE